MRKLYRLPRDHPDRKIAGICGGIGEVYNIDPTLIRLGLVFLALLSMALPVLVTYVIAWIIIPDRDSLEDYFI